MTARPYTIDPRPRPPPRPSKRARRSGLRPRKIPAAGTAQRQQGTLTRWSLRRRHARQGTARCHTCLCRGRDRARRAVTTRTRPASRGRSRPRPALRGPHAPTAFGRPRRLPRRRHRCRTARLRGQAGGLGAGFDEGSARLSVAVLCRMSSVCHAISSSSRLRTRARARSRPGVVPFGIEVPSASRMR